jgi:hypothetical protein
MGISRLVSLLSKTALLAFMSGVVWSFASAQTPAASGSDAVTKATPSPERLDMLAHRLLAAAVKSNGLAADDLNPWHLKVDFNMRPGDNESKPVSGTFEEWYADHYHWRRTYTSSEPEWNGSEWRVGKAHRYVTKRRHSDFDEYWLTSRVARPVVNPLSQVDDIRPEDALLVQRETTNGVTLNCTSLAHPIEQYGRMPEWVVPTMCFDSELHVRIMRSENIVGQFFDQQPFQGRTVARDVQLIISGRLYCEMKVAVLETVGKVDEALLKPDADSAEKPFFMESGDPQPVAIYQVGASLPLVVGHPYSGSLAFPVIIGKDGSVKVEGRVGGGRCRTSGTPSATR